MTAVLILWGHALAALLFGALALARWRRRAEAGGTPVGPVIVATALTALWALAVAGVDARDVSTYLAEGARNLAWLGVMVALVRRSRADSATVMILYAVVMLVTLAATAMALVAPLDPPRHLFRMLATTGALLLLCHLAQAVTGPRAGGIRLFALAMGAMWALDLAVALVAVAGSGWTVVPVVMRGPVMVGVAILLAAAATHRGDAAVTVSRTVATRALLVLALLLYIGLTAITAELAALLDRGVARAAQTAIVCGATAALLTFVSTPWLRAWLRVKVAKHLFGHRYDYRVEWQRFTTTLGLPGEGGAPLGTRIAKAVANLTDSPAGLAMGATDGALAPLAGWRWAEERRELPTALAKHLAATGRIVSLDALRSGEGATVELATERAAVPRWLLDDPAIWAIVPLLHGDDLAGAIVLARPPVDRALDWEDFDLLRVAGRQAASYLAEDRSHAALADARRFDEFNRRFAFLLHDIKNVASQLTLVARNAERHADNPEFRADMVATLRESSGRMATLLARLGQHDGVRAEPLQAIDLAALARRVAAARRAQHPVVVEGTAILAAWGQPARLEQALSHLVQNAVEASGSGEPVRLTIETEGNGLLLSVIDRGGGMAPGFVRDQLFRPFVSSKPDGFGIGACEARQLVRAMGGEMLVDSREGEGSCFRIRLPAAPRIENRGMTRPVLLVVEDDAGLARQLRWAYENYEVVIAGDRATALDAVRLHEPAVVTLDLGLPPDPDGSVEGFATLHAILGLAPGTKVIVASGHGARDSALRAIADGAWDFYAKPIDIDALGLIVARAFHVHALEAENRRLAARATPDGFGGLLYASPEMAAVARTLERVAPADVSVMLLGASGTGKELLARGLHDASPRRRARFVAINCAAIPETLLESELFGHEKGAFTGAVKTTEGKIEQAAGGTLFLDEIGDVPLPLQVKLLRFLQERVIERIGGRRSIAVDTRIVCATHQDVDAMVADGRFREDLYYRLAEIVVRIPALADRTGDAALLARHFVGRYAATLNPGVTGLAADARAAVEAWRWPGNVRELENRVKRAVIMADGKLVTAADLDLAPLDPADLNLRTAREAADRRAIGRALAQAEGNVSGTARLLGISRPTLYDLFKAYGITP